MKTKHTNINKHTYTNTHTSTHTCIHTHTQSTRVLYTMMASINGKNSDHTL